MSSSPARFSRIPGSEPTRLDMEKLFLAAVSKENQDFRGKIRKNVPYKILKIYIEFSIGPIRLQNFLLSLFGLLGLFNRM